jgi:phosphomannomutase
MTKIKFGTDGWRAIIAEDFTVDNIKRVADATARWIISQKGNSVVIGHDCRFGGELFLETTAKVMGYHNIKCYVAKGFVSTPMVSLGAVTYHAAAGIVLTASHNPPSYNGFKIKSAIGGPALQKEINKVESMIEDKFNHTLPSIEKLIQKNLLQYVDLESDYVKHVETHFDMDLIRKSNIKLAYDAMYGAGQNVIKRVLPNAITLRAEYNPSFLGQAPEPLHKNLLELSELIKKDKTISCGLATDGDADRIAMYDEDGNYVDSHHILLLLIYYFKKYKEESGKVVVSFSVCEKIKHLCEHYGLECVVTPIGFKYISEYIVSEKVLVGGEESGGISCTGHIPERDGIWMGLVLLEFMAKTGKTIKTLVNEIYEIVGTFAFERYDLQITEDLKQRVLQMCKEDKFKAFGSYKVERVETIDGYKYHFNRNEWVMIRASGTEPVLRVYSEAPTTEAAFAILDTAKSILLAL